MLGSYLLSLEEQYGDMAEVEVDEVFRFCVGFSMVPDTHYPAYSPWVTKLPKFRPTMQCHVAPFFASNWVTNQHMSSVLICRGRPYFSFDVLRDILSQGKPCPGVGWA